MTSIPLHSISLPASKSISARALIASALSAGQSGIGNLSRCEDTRLLAEAATSLGSGGRTYVGSGGASLRFMIAAAASIPGLRLTIDCSGQLRRRPVGPLVDALRGIGAELADCAGTAPFSIRGRRLGGGEMSIDPSASSQFVSALMLAAPLWSDGLRLRFSAKPVSFPYIEMTAALMRRFGAEAETTESGVAVPPGEYSLPNGFTVEADWSAASYVYELAAIHPGTIWRVASLTPPEISVQGDSAAASIFARIGIRTRYNADGSADIFAGRQTTPAVFEADMNGTPDLVPALAATLCALRVPFRLSGVSHLRHKESDRIAALVGELGRCGWRTGYSDGSLVYDGSAPDTPQTKTVADSHADHRMAMALAPLAPLLPRGLEIDSPGVVDKSFPGYWDILP